MVTDGHRLALEQLRELAAVSSAIEVVAVHEEAELGRFHVEISVDCSGAPHASDGIVLRPRERFSLLIPSDFPFSEPWVRVRHTRWAGAPHVQWGRHLCLYAAPSIQWVPADGMHGLIDRLVLWLERASLGELDPDELPLHPPVAYVWKTDEFVVVRADIGDKGPAPQAINRGSAPGRPATGRPHGHRILIARCEVRSDRRADIVEWVEPAEWLRRFVRGDLLASSGRRAFGALTVLTDGEMFFEYPDRVEILLSGLETLGVSRPEFFDALGIVAAVNDLLRNPSAGDEVFPLRVLIGTPSRRSIGGTLRHHLVCWQVDDLGRRIAEDLPWSGSENEALAELSRRMHELTPQWVRTSSIDWVQVMEARAEITQRRDRGSAASWVQGKRILVLGCGALGAPIAEFCVRAGASQVLVVDKDTVTPGILVRQPYVDADIGTAKAQALADRLNSIRQDQPVQPLVGSVQTLVLAEGMPPPAVDLVIDATANAAVGSLIELRRTASRSDWPPFLMVIIGHDARRGVVTVSRQNATGAGRDILRQLMLACRRPNASRLSDVKDDLFPDEPRALFQPEPGCSEPTFLGSAAELSALAGLMLDAGLSNLSEHAGGKGDPMAAGVVRLSPADASDASRSTVDWLGWPNAHCVIDRARGYEVRISQPALSEIRAECRRSARVRGATVETGGLLLGRVDDACRCIWIDQASGPPADSRLSSVHFDHGVDGVSDVIDHHRKRSGKETTYLGMWHVHPKGLAGPSPTDRSSMHALVAAAVGGPPRALMLILAGDEDRWSAWLSGGTAPEMFAQLMARQALGSPPPELVTHSTHESSSWPGGWALPVPHTNGKRRGFLARLFGFGGRRV